MSSLDASTECEIDYHDSTKTTTWDDRKGSTVVHSVACWVPSLARLPSSLDQNVPQYKRDFRRKLIYFRSQPAMRAQPGNCQIKIRRNHIFEDSYAEIMRQTPADLKKRLMIKFDGEDGLDYGGVSRLVGVAGVEYCIYWHIISREFFFLLSHEMFNVRAHILLEFYSLTAQMFSPSTVCLSTRHTTTIPFR